MQNSRTKATMEYERSDYTIGAVQPADVAEPDARNVVSMPPGVDHADLPVTFDRGKIVVHATIEGRKIELLLDSGADGITISPAWAKELGLTVVNARNVLVARAVDIGQAIVPSLNIGPVSMHDVVVEVLPAGGRLSQSSFDGLLGFDFLAELGVQVDYQHGTVRVVRGDSQAPPSDPSTISLNVRLGDLVPLTSITIDGARADRMVIDTGGSGSLLLFDYFSRRHPEVFRARAYNVPTLSGVGGNVDIDAWNLNKITLGRISFTNFTGFRVLSKQSFAINDDGLIGYDFLRYFTVVFDYTHGHVYLTRNSGAAPPDH